MHLAFAHCWWKNHLSPDDKVIDATCGNGKDTWVLAHLVPQGEVIALDIQKSAIEQASRRVPLPWVTFLHRSHIDLPPGEFKLIVYNLGYLPGGDKSLTTITSTTLISVEQALELLPLGGAVSIMCYPSHPEGIKEEEALLLKIPYFCKIFPTLQVSYHRWEKRTPSLLIIKK